MAIDEIEKARAFGIATETLTLEKGAAWPPLMIFRFGYLVFPLVAEALFLILGFGVAYPAQYLVLDFLVMHAGSR